MLTETTPEAAVQSVILAELLRAAPRETRLAAVDALTRLAGGVPTMRDSAERDAMLAAIEGWMARIDTA